MNHSVTMRAKQATACRMLKNFEVFAMGNNVFATRFLQHIKFIDTQLKALMNTKIFYEFTSSHCQDVMTLFP